MDSPVGLGERGLAIWEALSNGDVAHDALVLEAARLADRLDELDSIIQGKGVLDLMQFRLEFPESDGEPFSVEVKFQNVLSEARQQQATFGSLIEKIGKLSLMSRGSKGGEVSRLPAGVTPLQAIRDRVKQETG